MARFFFFRFAFLPFLTPLFLWAQPSVQAIKIEGLGSLGTLGKESILQGGFSGLHVLKKEEGIFQALTHSDRGPNGEVDVKDQRPFYLPRFQPHVVDIVLNLSSNGSSTPTAWVHQTIPLWKKSGQPMTGLPNLKSKPSLREETPVDRSGKRLKPDPMGMDLEGLALDAQGFFWLVEEYRPSIAWFSSSGTLLNRFVPLGLPEKFGTPVLPAIYSSRHLNNGFEGACLEGEKLYAVLQTPLAANGTGSDAIRILEFDIETKSPTAEYVYLLENQEHADKIGDISCLGDSRFLLIEQNGKTGKKSIKNVFQVDASGATNILGTPYHASLESLAKKDLEATKLRTVKKELAVSLHNHGFGHIEKFEGVARVDDHRIVLINDNDFGISNGSIDPDKQSYLFIIDFSQDVSALGN